MITPGFVRMMAAYNREMNRNFYAVAARLSDADRRLDRGAFWRSIHGTFNHLLWADRVWMARFDGWAKPTVPLRESAALIEDFTQLSAARIAFDDDLAGWADRIEQRWLDQDIVWFSGAAGREIRANRAGILVHFFNHQTHHRGQVHAMLTAAGERPGDTDLFIVVPPPGMA